MAQRARPQRRSIRRPDFDYALPGAYFVTVCTHKRRCTLGRVADDEMIPNAVGSIVLTCLRQIPDHFPRVEFDACVLMPNHLHAIILVSEAHGAIPLHQGLRATHASPLRGKEVHGPGKRSLGAIMGSFKAAASTRINQTRGTPGGRVWQRNYYEHIIRNEDELNRVRQYVVENPRNWAQDPENPAAASLPPSHPAQ